MIKTIGKKVLCLLREWLNGAANIQDSKQVRRVGW
jgi:hypothetical protein